TAAHYAATATYVTASDKLGARDEVLRVVGALAEASPRGDALLNYVEAAARSAAHLVVAGRQDLAAALFAAIDRHEPSLSDGAVLARVSHARATRALMNGDLVTF